MEISAGRNPASQFEGETDMTNGNNLVTQISTAVTGFVLVAYGIAFLINTLNWA